MQQDHGFFRESPLFEGLDETAIRRLVEVAKIREFSVGELIVEEGSDSDSVFLLYDGSVSISTTTNSGDEIRLKTLSERGAFFGEVGLVDPGPRSATVKSESTAVLLELSLAGFEEFFRDVADSERLVLRNVARVLAQRIRNSNELLASR